MNSIVSKIVSVSIISALMVSGTGVQTISGAKDAKTQEEQSAADKINKAISENVSFASTGADKEETVYVITDAAGKVTSKIVSDKLNNKNGSNVIDDKSDLTDIESVKTDAWYTKNSDGTITWNTNGEDVYYQGTTNKELPVDVAIHYYLDDEEISPDELAGKSGKVTIEFEYTNNTKVDVKAGNETVKMSVPFTMISGLILPKDKFSNVLVSNGKVIDDGNNSIVIGYAIPGLCDELNISLGEDSDIPDCVRITADVEDFSLLTTLTMGSSDLLASVDVDTAKTKEELEEVINKLVSATDDLKGGTDKLKDGTNKLVEGFEGNNGAISGAKALSVGAVDLDKGLNSLKSSIGDVNDGKTVIGAVEALTNGANKLDKGMEQLIAKLNDSKDAKGNVVTGLFSAITQLKEGIGSSDTKSIIKDASSGNPSTLTGGITAVDEGVAQLQKGLENTVVTLKKNIEDNKNKMESISQALSYIQKTGTDPQTGTTATKEVIDSYKQNLAALTGANQALNLVLKNMDDANMAESVDALKKGTGNLKDNSVKLAKGMEQLSNGAEALKDGVSQIKSGTESLAGGTKKLNSKMPQLSNGISMLSEGASKLSEGNSSLYNGINALYDGAKQLSDGAKQLSDGVSEIKENATDKVVDAYDNDITDTLDKIEATLNAAKQYKIFTDARDGQDTSVKFIYRSGSIG